MDNISLVQVIDRIQNLSNSLRSILLGELPIFTDPIEQLATRSQLRNDVEFVLNRSD